MYIEWNARSGRSVEGSTRHACRCSRRLPNPSHTNDGVLRREWLTTYMQGWARGVVCLRRSPGCVRFNAFHWFMQCIFPCCLPWSGGLAGAPWRPCQHSIVHPGGKEKNLFFTHSLHCMTQPHILSSTSRHARNLTQWEGEGRTELDEWRRMPDDALQAERSSSPTQALIPPYLTSHAHLHAHARIHCTADVSRSPIGEQAGE